MKRSVPYILGSAAFLILALLLIISARNPVRTFDERITLRQKDKIPYGTYVAYHLLPALFPQAQVSYEHSDLISSAIMQSSGNHRALILMADYFNADETELRRLLDFAREGNYVFIIARNLSYDATRFFRLSDYGDLFGLRDDDSLQLALQQPPFQASGTFVYPGKKFESFFSGLDTQRTLVLGRSRADFADFVQLKSGGGSFFIHLAPLAFSNYFILHKNNIEYYRNALSVIPRNARRVVWNDYFLSRHDRQQKQPGILKVLWKYPAFQWALLTAAGTLLLMILLEMRRKQRPVPALEKPGNDSLDFVKTIGRLYYERGDHKNLAKKMITYFLEHVRARYKIATENLDSGFIGALHAKTGYAQVEIKRIVRSIEAIEAAPEVSEYDLSHFYQQLESFYQNT